MQHDYKSFHATVLPMHSTWVVGLTGSGKTARLIEQFQAWAAIATPNWQIQPVCLVFAAMGDNRLQLVERIQTATEGRYPFDSVTPFSFFEQEVMLYWPLLMQQLDLKTQFPLRLRPETEQDLATRLWQPALESGRLRQAGVSDYFMVRRTLDLLQLAAVSATPHEQIPELLEQGMIDQAGSPALWHCMGELLEQWWQWCLDRGLLTYGIVTELYWRYLLPQPTYQQQLRDRYCAFLADDVDEYPAVMRLLFEFFMDQGLPGLLTFNPIGGMRVGLGADPDTMVRLADRCQVETLSSASTNLGYEWGPVLVDCIREPLQIPQLPDSIQVIQTLSKAQLLRQTAETIATAIQDGLVEPQEIAIVSPGLDAITRYTLQSILASKGIQILSLNSQQPLISSPLVRTLLNLLAVVYPELGRLIDREAIAEMLVLLSQSHAYAAVTAEASSVQLPDFSGHPPDPSFQISTTGGEQPTLSFKPRIDAVRAGLLTDHCFVPDPTTPQLLPITQFPRWDRLGYQASQAYAEILQWIAAQQALLQQASPPNPVMILDRAIQKFFGGGSTLSYDQLVILRELMETAQHYWDVEARMQQADHNPSLSVARFIQLLRNGTITANPFPVRPIGKAAQAVTLSTIYQYRLDRRYHRWQFWLDAGSPLWLAGGGTRLFGSPLFLRERLNRAWTAAEALEMDQNYLDREVQDLLSRAQERVYLCHSELGINGQEQAGSLMPIVNAAVPVNLIER